MLHPGGSLNVAVRVLGIALLGYGAVRLASYFLAKDGERSLMGAAVGAVVAVMGLVVLVAPELTISILPVAAGVAVAAFGVRDLVLALRLREADDEAETGVSAAGDDAWKLGCALAAVKVALGVVIFADPFATMEALVTLLGVALVYDGIANLVARR